MYRVVLFLDNDHFRCIEATSIDYYYDDEKEKPAVEIVDGNNGDVYTSTFCNGSRDWEKFLHSMTDAARYGYADLTSHGRFERKQSNGKN